MSLRDIWLATGFVWVIVVFYLSLGNVSGPIEMIGIDKLYHLITYCFLSIWFLQISKNKKYILIVIISLILMGVGLEFLQALTPHRMFQYYDMLANSIGVLIGFGISFTVLGNILTLLIQKNN